MSMTDNFMFEKGYETSNGMHRYSPASGFGCRKVGRYPHDAPVSEEACLRLLHEQATKIAVYGIVNRRWCRRPLKDAMGLLKLAVRGRTPSVGFWEEIIDVCQ